MSTTCSEILRKQNTRFEVVERAAENGDQLNIDFVGNVDGEAFAGGSAKGTPLVLGSGRMIPGFEDGLVGAKAGEERVLNLTFPEDYQNLRSGRQGHRVRRDRQQRRRAASCRS